MAQDASHIYCLINYEDNYVQPLILAALNSLPPSSYTILPFPSSSIPPQSRILYIAQYESLPFSLALASPTTHLINAYAIRKALIRKHYLSTTVSHWLSKHPESVLKSHVQPAVEFEVDYAEFLDEALVEAFELKESWERNEGKELEGLPVREREWWILKPGMSERAQGIRLFSSEEELTAIFEEWEGSESDEEGEEDDDDEVHHSDDETHATSPAKKTGKEDKDRIITSHLRHFIAQPYIHPPLLLPQLGSRKFHIRTYVLCVGALTVYVYKPMLALFAAAPYVPPWTNPSDLQSHLTNTCVQGTSVREGSVRGFWDLPDDVELSGGGTAGNWKDDVFSQICTVTGEVFEAAARAMSIHFQPLPNAFEVFGLDFLVDASGTAWLLEVNAFPDFRQTGDELSGVVAELWEDVVEVAVKSFFGLGGQREGTGRMRKVRSVDLGRR